MYKVIAHLLILAVMLSLTASSTLVQTISPKKAIYILPGYMESQLFSKKFADTTIWVGLGLATELAIDATGQQAELTNNSSGICMSAYADRKKDKSGVLDLFLPMITSIKTCLAINGLSSTYNVEFFSYNWLADLNDTARDLAADINTKGYDKVILICHSNGGLLASTYISQSTINKNKVEKAICLASPLWGTYTALEPVETGTITLMDGTLPMGLLESEYDVFAKPISKNWVRNWAKNSPNTYQSQAGNEYISRIPILSRADTGTQAITCAADYYTLLNKSPNVNATLMSDGYRSLKYLRETVFGEDVLQKWDGIDLTMIGCEYGFVTPISEIYHMSGTKAIYDGAIYNKDGDGSITAMSMNGDGRFKWVNLPDASHIEIVTDVRALDVINNIILDKPVSSTTDTSLCHTTLATSPSVGMSDMIRVEIKSTDPLDTPTLTNAGISLKVYNQKGSIVARSQGGAQLGFSLNNFIYSSWSTSDYMTNIICYIPKNGYKLEVFTGNLSRSSSLLKVYTETLDRSGAFLTQNEYTVTGANLLTGSAFTLEGNKVAPTASSEAEVITVSTATFRQNWQFSSDIMEVHTGTTTQPAVIGADADSFVKSDYTWTSSDTSTATVSTSGVITPISTGTSVITATAKDNSCKIASFTVRCTIPVE